MPATDAQSLEQDDGLLDAFGPHLHLLADLELVAHLLPGRLGDEDLAADGAGLDARGEVHVASHHAVFHALRRADIAEHHLTRMNADAHLDLWQVVLAVLLVDLFHGDLHRHGAGDSPFGIVFVPYRRAEQDEDRIANELIDGALVLLDDRHHGREVAIEQLHHAIGR